MFAVECFDQRRLERRGLRVAGDHRHPGDRLQDGPVAAQRKRERNDCNPIEQSGGHDEHATPGIARVNGKTFTGANKHG